MSKNNKELAQKQAEMRILKIEESTITKLLTQVNEQINRLSIEELKMKEIIMARNVQNTIAIQQNNEADPLSINDNNTGPSSSSNNSSFQNAFNQLKNYELPGFQKQISIDQVNLTDLDLNIPVSSSGGRKVYQDGEDEYSENDEDEECLLFKL